MRNHDGIDMTKLSPLGQANMQGVWKGEEIYDSFVEDSKRAMEINQKMLLKVLEDNKDTEYGKKYNFAQIKTIEEYQKNVPLVTYDDIKDEIYRMTDDGEENILTAYPIIHYSKSSGTSGEPKRIPFTSEIVKMHQKYGVSYLDGLVATKIGYDWVDGKKISLMEAEISTLPCGITYGSFSGKTIVDVKPMLGYLFTSPAEALIPEPGTNNRYLYTRFALVDTTVTGAFCSVYSFLLEFMRYIEANWEMLVKDIAEGTIDESIAMSDEVRKSIMEKIQPMPERAEELRKIFEQGFDEPFAPKVWPRLQYIVGIGSGSFHVYADKLRTRYLGNNVAQYRNGLFASEGHFTIPVDINSDDAALIPDSIFYEFLEENETDESKCLLMNEIEIGKNYEIIATNLGGLYRYRIGDVIQVVGKMNELPIVQFLYRRNQTINMMGEKTTEYALSEAADRTAKEIGFDLVDFSVYPNPDREPLGYDCFMEIKNRGEVLDLENVRKVLQKNMSEGNPSLGNKLDRGFMAPVRLMLLKQGAYQEYKNMMIERGTSGSQMKPIHVIITEEQRDFFFARVQ